MTMTTIHDSIGDTLADFGGFLRCETCHTTEPLGNVSRRLSGGWPRCCGYTMRWWTQRQIDAGEHLPDGRPCVT